MPIGIIASALLQGVGTKTGEQLSEKAMEWVERLIQKVKNEPEKVDEMEIPDDVKKEIENQFSVMLQRQARPVYIGGVALYFVRQLSKNEKEELKGVLGDLQEESIGIAGNVDDWSMTENAVFINFYEREEQLDENDVRSFAQKINDEMENELITSYSVY